MRTPYIARELVFVPNAFCNFGCKYCYLGELTDTKESTQDMDKSFRRIAARLKEQGVLISKVILHGAELTSAPLEDVQNYCNPFGITEQKITLGLSLLHQML